MSELSLIEAIKKFQQPLPPGCIGIGDDAALISSTKDESWLVATDMLLDGRHFDSNLHSLHSIGRKVLAVNLSDIAAMGGWPRYALVSLAIPECFGRQRVLQLWSGLQSLADEFNVIVIGGDTNAWQANLVVNVCVIGTPHTDACILRRGAQRGDGIYVTGELGGSLESQHHLTFQPRLREAQQLIDRVRPSAMMDISDGLATDLSHICKASSVGADLIAEAIPVSTRVDPHLDPQTRLCHALTDGEDFELLFTLAPHFETELKSLTFPCYRIGTISKELGIRLDGEVLNLQGFEHRF